MAGFTNYAYRAIVRRFGGVGLSATEMLSARGLREMNARHKGTPERLWGVRDEPRPLAVQIWDNDPTTLAEAAGRLVEDYHPSVIDINFGCPARDVSEKAQSGAYLLGDPDRVGAIVARVVAACGSTPVTAKIRLGPSDETITAVDVVQAIEGAGGAAVTVHGRTARQMFRGQADWDRIAPLKPHLAADPAGGQRRPENARGGARSLRPLRGRRRDDRPGGRWRVRGCFAGRRPRCPASRSRRSRASPSSATCCWTTTD